MKLFTYENTPNVMCGQIDDRGNATKLKNRHITRIKRRRYLPQSTRWTQRLGILELRKFNISPIIQL
jgi:hypothetical protein